MDSLRQRETTGQMRTYNQMQKELWRQPGYEKLRINFDISGILKTLYVSYKRNFLAVIYGIFLTNVRQIGAL